METAQSSYTQVGSSSVAVADPELLEGGGGGGGGFQKVIKERAKNVGLASLLTLMTPNFVRRTS